LKRFLTINSSCIQRTCLEFPPPDQNTSLDLFLNELDEIEQFNNELSEATVKRINAGDDINYFKSSCKIIVNRTILFTDLIGVASFLAPLPNSSRRNSFTSVSGTSSSFSSSFSSSSSSSNSKPAPRKSNVLGIGSGGSGGRSAFLFKIQEDSKNVNDLDELNNLSEHGVMPSSSFDESSSSSSFSSSHHTNYHLYHQRARGRLRLEATVSDGTIATWYSGRARRTSTEINEAFPSSEHGGGGVGMKRSSHLEGTSDTKSKKKRNERSFIYETGYASKLEEQIQVWNM